MIGGVWIEGAESKNPGGIAFSLPVSDVAGLVQIPAEPNGE